MLAGLKLISDLPGAPFHLMTQDMSRRYKPLTVKLVLVAAFVTDKQPH